LIGNRTEKNKTKIVLNVTKIKKKKENEARVRSFPRYVAVYHIILYLQIINNIPAIGKKERKKKKNT